MKFYRIKRIVVLEDNKVIFLMKNGDSIFQSCYGDGYHNQDGKGFNPLYDEFTGELVGFTEPISIEVEAIEVEE